MAGGPDGPPPFLERTDGHLPKPKTLPLITKQAVPLADPLVRRLLGSRGGRHVAAYIQRGEKYAMPKVKR